MGLLLTKAGFPEGGVGACGLGAGGDGPEVLLLPPLLLLIP